MRFFCATWRRNAIKILLQITIIILFWLMALIAWWATLWHLDLFADFGGELPDVSHCTGESIRNNLPFWIAAAFSGVVVYELFRPGNRRVPWSVWLLCIAIVLLLVSIVAMTLPMVKMCGEFVPGWPVF